ncbi:MAG: hypothetical protein AAGA30_05135 [Planctomycetota bacterium]
MSCLPNNDCNFEVASKTGTVLVTENSSASDEDVSERSETDVTPSIYLPPQFLADDPDFVDHSVKRHHNPKVLLPDGLGGVTAVDSQIVRIQHRGQTVELKTLPAEKKRFRQMWINIVSIILGGLFLWIFFKWVL